MNGRIGGESVSYMCSHTHGLEVFRYLFRYQPCVAVSGRGWFLAT